MKFTKERKRDFNPKELQKTSLIGQKISNGIRFKKKQQFIPSNSKENNMIGKTIKGTEFLS